MTEDIKSRRRIFIVDDHPIVRQGLTQLINQEAGLVVCGEASDISSALPAIQETAPDLVIVDLSLGTESGIRLIGDLLLKEQGLLILVLSMHDESLYAERCFKAGAKGYIMKQELPEKVILALKKILQGDVYISDNLSARIVNKFAAEHPGTYGLPIERLSNRELEVFQLIGQGLKTRRIAEQLNLSIKTVETYIDHIKSKMDIDDSRNLLLHAAQWFMNGRPLETQTKKPSKPRQ